MMDTNNNSGMNTTPTPAPRRRFAWGWAVVWVLVLGLLAVVGLGLLNKLAGSVGEGQMAPNFTFTNFSGEQIKSTDLRGKVVVLNFWASWCKPCEEEAWFLEEAWRYYQADAALKDQVIFLGVAWTDTEANAKVYLDKFGVTYPNGPDLRTSISQAFRITGVPETYIIDREGRTAFRQLYQFSSTQEIIAAIEAVLR
jgi:cytochrome c biogenesis protein CcmG/thiol:disulfide interchange protein DsbE